MRSLAVRSENPSSPSYIINIGLGIATNVDTIADAKLYSKIVAVFDPTVRSLWPNINWLNIDTIVLPDSGEQQKKLSSLDFLWNAFQSHGLDRHSLIINVGGGATCDVTAFAAATYMRGVRFINIPTTLLSQVDSSIGGKNGINFGSVKNLVGTFSQPDTVIIDLEFLKTLPAREISSGFAEVIKHGIIADKNFFQILSEKEAVHNLPVSALEDIVLRSCEIKASVVEVDVHEKGLRKTLNYGHTVGHALESISQKGNSPLLHGEAISIGMCVEAGISVERGMLSPGDLDKIATCFSHHGLPTKVPSYDVNEILELMRLDKKNKEGKILFALPTAIGSCAYDIHVEEIVVRNVLEKLS